MCVLITKMQPFCNVLIVTEQFVQLLLPLTQTDDSVRDAQQKSAPLAERYALDVA